MTRFVQYPFDKTKMPEVREWVANEPAVNNLRSIPGVQSVEISFCPGEGMVTTESVHEMAGC